MEPQKTMVCRCDNCNNEAEMTIKCEEAVREAPAQVACCGSPPKRQVKRTLVCIQCGSEADLIVDL